MSNPDARPTAGSGIVGSGRLDTDEFVAMTIDGQVHGEVQFLRDDDNYQRVNRVAVWRLTADQVPYESPYEFRNDETFVVLEGELEITFDDGNVQNLIAGDVLSVAANTSSHWRINKPFRKFVVEVGR